MAIPKPTLRSASLAITVMALSWGAPLPGIEMDFIRGDANGDLLVDIGDPVYVLAHLFAGGPGPCADAQDTNDDGAVDIADAVYALAFLFGGGAPPPAPWPDAGADPTADDIGCSWLDLEGTNAQGYEVYSLEIDPTGVVAPLKLIRIPAGTFTMGQFGGYMALPHDVELTEDYLISKYEVTNSQYKHFCDTTGFPYPTLPNLTSFPVDHFTNPAYADHPVIMVSWDDLHAPGGFLEWAGLALPTEAQWEYAARGTTGSIFPWGDTLPEADGVFRANGGWGYYTSLASDGWVYTCPVDTGPFSSYPSPFGTVGQSGNVREWCLDWLAPYTGGVVSVDPTGPETGTVRVHRGGGFTDLSTGSGWLRTWVRTTGYVPSARSSYLGFRPARAFP